MSDQETAPPADKGEDNASIDSILASRHQTQGDHETLREVGDQAQPLAPQPEPSAQAAPTPALAPAPEPQPAPAAEGQAPDPATDPRSPKWFREHMVKVNRERAQERAELERLRTQGPGPVAQPQAQPEPRQLTAEELGRPLTVGEAVNLQRQMAEQQTRFANEFQLKTKLDNSEWRARSQHGDLFDETFAWLDTQPDLQDHFIRQPDPWGAAIAHYQRVKLAEEIGDDPAKWRESERERMRSEILAEMQAGGTGMTRQPQSPPPPPRPQLPQPASTARSAQPRDEGGRFAGSAPIESILPNRF